MKKQYKTYLILLSIFLIVACSKGGGESPAPDPDPIASPTASTLVFPENNTECNEGTSLNDKESNVIFKWNASDNTDSYTFNVTNLNTGTTSTANTNTNEILVTILKGTPYSWSVISRANGTDKTGISPTWKFYNQGPGLESFAPFPANAISPKRGTTVPTSNTITLEWEASDVDNDIISYGVFLGTSATTMVNISTTTTTSLANVAVTSNTIYYWQIITKDNNNHSSKSDVFEFKVE